MLRRYSFFPVLLKKNGDKVKHKDEAGDGNKISVKEREILSAGDFKEAIE